MSICKNPIDSRHLYSALSGQAWPVSRSRSLIKTHDLLHPERDHVNASELNSLGTSLVLAYYVLMSSSMVVALYNFCVTSFLAICARAHASRRTTRRATL